MKLITPLEEFSLLKSTDLATLECSVCNKHFQRKKSSVSNPRNSNDYCSNKCQASLRITAKEIPCNSCGLMVRRIPKDLKKAGGAAYCSRSCAAKENNRKYPKKVSKQLSCTRCGAEAAPRRKLCNSCFSPKQPTPKRKQHKTKTCACGVLIWYGSHSCRNCYSHHKKAEWSKRCKTMTLGDYRNALSVKGKHVSWRNVRTRMFARRWNKDLCQMPCQKCQYSLHVELAHIKSVSSFPDTATLWEVNAPENLLVLCRNCHWELDHGTIQLKDIPDRV